MKFHLKLTRGLFSDIHLDLHRAHKVASERIGFLRAAFAGDRDKVLILPSEYRPVADADYVDNPAAGASIGPEAIRKALEWADSWHGGVFHVHAHLGCGVPRFSGIDIAGNQRLIPTFFNVAPGRPHGAIILSEDAATAAVWTEKHASPQLVAKVSIVGVPIRSWWLR